MSSRVLVSGASGYLGVHIVKTALDAGYLVRGTVRNLQNETKVGPLKELPGADRLELVEAHLLDEDSWVSAVKNCDYVLHIASPLPPPGTVSRKELVAVSKDGTMNVLKACSKHPQVKRVVLTSSTVTIIPPVDVVSGKIYTEDDWAPPHSHQLFNYNVSKQEAERAAWDFVNSLTGDSKFELAVINPSAILGPILSSGNKDATSLSYVSGIVTAKSVLPKIQYPMCDVRDVAQAHINAMTEPEAAGKRHIIATDSYWMSEMGKILGDELNPKGYSVPSKDAPGWILWMVSWFSPMVKYMVYENLNKEVKVSNERMRKVLKVEPTPYEKTLIDTANSMISLKLI